VVSVCMIFLTLRLGGTIARTGEWKWYALVAVVSLLCVLPATFLLKEPNTPAPVAGKGRLRDYFDAVRNTPHFLRLCLVVATTFMGGQLITNYYRLFTKEQLGLGLDEALRAFAWMPVIAFFASYPIGWLADRISPKYVTQAGAVLLALSGFCGVRADSIWDLRLMALLVGMGTLCVEVACNAYLFSFLPPGRNGQLSGFVNIFRGGPRFLMFFGAGLFIEIFDRNYRIAFGGSIVCAIVAFILLCGLPRQGNPSRESGSTT
ncbi:MAG TPA: MFS transporter, partial [Opitutus sp.]|nr:MFS transporter [Opitutus sp.]